ncbi:MAG: hypothetical protein WAV90_02155 [Gordonia amarae]
MQTQAIDRIRDAIERASWTAFQQFTAVLFAGSTSTVVGLPWLHAGASAAVAGLISGIAVIQILFPVGVNKFWSDLIVRTIKTFFASLLGIWLTATFSNGITFTWGSALNVAAVATMMVIAKSLLARKPSAGGDGNASTLAPEVVRSAYTPTSFAIRTL